MGDREAAFLGLNATKLRKAVAANFEPTTGEGDHLKEKAAKRAGGDCYVRLARCATSADRLCQESPWA